MATISTPLTKLFGIKHPILLAGLSLLVIMVSSQVLTRGLLCSLPRTMDYRNERRCWT